MIWLLRHGDAEDGDGKPDAERELTAKGERQSRDAGRALKAIGVKLDVCLSSPKVRARQTAELACAELGVAVELDERLAGGDFDPLSSPPAAARCCWSATSRTSRARSRWRRAHG